MAGSAHIGPGATRRSMLAAAGAAGLAAVLAACGGGDTSGKTSGGGSKELAKTSDIPEGGGKIFTAQNVVVTQPTAGTFKAFSGSCTHLDCPLADVSNGTINCTCHGSKFDIADGSVKHGPATKPLPAVSNVSFKGGSITVN